MKICKECGKDKKLYKQQVYAELCLKCYRKNERSNTSLRTDRICTSCNSQSSTKWYSGPICRKCYRSKLYAVEKENKSEWYLNERICNNLRSRISKIVSGTVKQSSAVKDLGCSIDEFKEYIASKFEPGMSWDNYGHKTWHVDHIKPLAKFNLSSLKEFKEAVHYSNLQPLWAIDNLLKSNKYED